jgi:hypothetical protein
MKSRILLLSGRILFNQYTLSLIIALLRGILIDKESVLDKQRLSWTLVTISCRCFLVEALSWAAAFKISYLLVLLVGILILRVLLLLAWINNRWNPWFLRYITAAWCVLVVILILCVVCETLVATFLWFRLLIIRIRLNWGRIWTLSQLILNYNFLPALARNFRSSLRSRMSAFTSFKIRHVRCRNLVAFIFQEVCPS